MKTRLAGLCFAAALVAATFTGMGDALARSAKITSSYFLAYNEKQQSIFVDQLMNGNSDLVAECAPNESVDQITKELVAYMRANPRYMQRPAHLPFTEMMLGKCHKEQ